MEIKTQQNKFIFKILSVGSFKQLLPDQITFLSRPCIYIGEGKKKWGNEYFLYNEHLDEVVQDTEGSQCFLGVFGIDAKKRSNIRLIKWLDAPLKPDYFVVTIDHVGVRIDKQYDLRKADPTSHSKIFSTAYNRIKEGEEGFEESRETYRNQTVFLLQHHDEVEIAENIYRFSAKSEALELI